MISIGKFDNHSIFTSGSFIDNIDRLGSQAKTILISQLQQTRHFNILGRENPAEMKREAPPAKTGQTLKGALRRDGRHHRIWPQGSRRP